MPDTVLTKEEIASLKWAIESAKITGYREIALILIGLKRRLGTNQHPLCHEAPDEIEMLRAALDKIELTTSNKETRELAAAALRGHQQKAPE